jgi:Family of unknown function (DUF6002)
LRVSVVIPASGLPKLWASALEDGGELQRMNPICVWDGEDREGVKRLVTGFVESDAQRVLDEDGFRVWDSLHVDNYMVADVVRAFAEVDAWGVPQQPRLHAHTVSSAYGFLGHDLGTEIGGHGGAAARYLMVQHLATPDLVLWSHTGRIDDADVPAYHQDPATGRFAQNDSLFFPPTVEALQEIVEPTFYTRRPPTLERIADRLPGARGRGMVVSRQECRSRYAEVMERLAAFTDVQPIDDQDDVREWSLVMAFTGAMNAIDRGLVEEAEIVVHGSGFYGASDVGSRSEDALTRVASSADVATAVRRACATAGD